MNRKDKAELLQIREDVINRLKPLNGLCLPLKSITVTNIEISIKHIET
jgi:hypothetical protein